MNYLYLVDDMIYYKTSKKIYSTKYAKDVLIGGKVNNEKEFYKKTYQFLKDNNLINIFLSQRVTLVTNPLYTDLDKSVLKDILEKLNFTNINFLNILDLLNLVEVNYIECNQQYIFIYYLDEFNQPVYKYIPSDFFLTTSELGSYIEKIMSINNKNIYIYGQIINNKMVHELERKLKNRIYYIEDANIYLLKICTK